MPSAARFRLAASAALAATALLAAGCGGSDEQGATAPAQTASTPAPTAEPTPPASPADGGRAVIETRYDLPRWYTSLAAKWGTAPDVSFKAQRKDDSTWRVLAVIKGDGKGERLEPKWLVKLPIERTLTAEEQQSVADHIDPANDDAKQLAEAPPVQSGDTAALEGYLGGKGDRDGSFVLAPRPNAGLASEAVRRAEEVIGAKRLKGGVTFTPDASTKIRARSGEPMTLDQFSALVPKHPVIHVEWSFTDAPTSATDFERAAPASIRVLTQ